MCAQGSYSLCFCFHVSGLRIVLIVLRLVATTIGAPSSANLRGLPTVGSPASPAFHTRHGKALCSSVAEEETYLVNMVKSLNSTVARQTFSTGDTVVAKLCRQVSDSAGDSNVIHSYDGRETKPANEIANETTVVMPAGVVQMLSKRAGGDDVVAVLSTIDEFSLPSLGNDAESVVKAVAFSLFKASDQSRVVVSDLEAPVVLHMGPSPLGSTCFYWDEDQERWSKDGVLTAYADGGVTCLVSHLSMFSVITNTSLVKALQCMDTTVFSLEGAHVLRTTNWYSRPAAWLLFAVVFLNVSSLVVAEFYDSQRSRHYGLQKAVPESFIESMAEQVEEITDAFQFIWQSLKTCRPSSLLPGLIVKCTRHTGSTFVNLNRKDMSLLRKLYRKHKRALQNGAILHEEHLERVYEQQQEYIDLVGKLLAYHNFLFSSQTPFYRRFIVLLWAERPWASTWEFNFRMSRRAQAMLRMCLMCSSLFKTALLFNAAGATNVNGPSICSEATLWERVAKIITFSIIAALLSPVVAFFFTRIAQIGIIKKAARQHYIVEMVEMIGVSVLFWTLITTYVSFCILFVCLFISNTAEKDTKDWCFTVFVQLALGYFFLPVFKALVLSSSAGVMRYWPAILAESKSKLMADIDGEDEDSDSISDSDIDSSLEDPRTVNANDEATTGPTCTSVDFVFHVAGSRDISIESFKVFVRAELLRRILIEDSLEDLLIKIHLGNVVDSVHAEVICSAEVLSAIDAADVHDITVVGLYGYRVFELDNLYAHGRLSGLADSASSAIGKDSLVAPASSTLQCQALDLVQDVVDTRDLKLQSSCVVDVAELSAKGDEQLSPERQGFASESDESNSWTLEDVASEYNAALRISANTVHDTKIMKSVALGSNANSQGTPETTVQSLSSLLIDAEFATPADPEPVQSLSSSSMRFELEVLGPDLEVGDQNRVEAQLSGTLVTSEQVTLSPNDVSQASLPAPCIEQSLGIDKSHTDGIGDTNAEHVNAEAPSGTTAMWSETYGKYCESEQHRVFFQDESEDSERSSPASPSQHQTDGSLAERLQDMLFLRGPSEASSRS